MPPLPRVTFIQLEKQMLEDSVPQNDDSATDSDKLFSQHYVNGDGVPHSATQDNKPTQDSDDTDPGYWRKHVFTVAEFLRCPPKQWHVQKVLGVQDFILLYGESGHGKTHIALDLAFSCATGRTFAGNFETTRPLSVCYATGEGAGGLTDRLRAVCTYYGTEDVPLYVIPDIPQLFQSTQTNGAMAFAAEWQAMARDGLVPAQLDVLMLDTLHNATFGSDENSAKDAGIVQASMRWLREMLGCAIVLVHHAGKSGATERGSSALRASADTVLRVSKVGNSYTLACEKQKDSVAWPTQAFSLVCPPNMPDGVRVSWDGDATTGAAGANTREARVIAHLQDNAGMHFTADEVAQAIDDVQRTSVQHTLRSLSDAGTVLKEKEPHVTRDGKTRHVYRYWVDSQ